ncbi:MAG: HigA family addiction module antidote protein [Rhodospirillaceae bacterium]|nr:HigA family addiction module antidote protein [Rhodospirillaceae bacterium]
MTNGESASSGRKEAPALPTWKSSTTTDRRRGMREPIHPGETLREDLDALGMSAAELARRIEVPTNRITGILNGRRAITGDTALRLGRFFGTTGEFWLNLQKLYELRLAEEKSGAAIARLPALDSGTDLHPAG